MNITRFGGAGGLSGVLMLLPMLGLVAQASAASVYKCRDAAGHIAYQDAACAGGAVETRIEIAAPPPSGPGPDYGVTTAARSARADRSRTSSMHAGAHAALSYECRAANGDIFYRHGGCPRSIRDEHAVDAHSGRRSAGAAARRADRSVAVSAVALPRSEVCRRLAAAGSVGRGGHEHDEQVSTYERNAGRDPCRHL